MQHHHNSPCQSSRSQWAGPAHRTKPNLPPPSETLKVQHSWSRTSGNSPLSRDLFCSYWSSTPVPRHRRAVLTAAPESSHCGSMQAAILQATAEMRAAPRPLPSSDWMKVISQWGAKSLTILWNLSRKLRRKHCQVLAETHSFTNPPSLHPLSAYPPLHWFHCVHIYIQHYQLKEGERRGGGPTMGAACKRSRRRPL